MGWDARIDIRLLIIKYFIIYIMLQVTHILVLINNITIYFSEERTNKTESLTSRIKQENSRG